MDLARRLVALHSGLLLMLVSSAAIGASYPVANAGIVDDWSYVWTAKEFARTGSIHYNGWATAILGWQIYAGALLIKVLGGLFTTVRLSVMLMSAGLIALVYKCFVLSGVSQRNSRFCAVTVLSSASFLQTSTAFMSDIPGMLAIFVTFYCCLRAHVAQSRSRCFWWLAFAIGSNSLLGTARQIAWLGLLILVPLTAWKERDRLKERIWILAGVWFGGVSFIAMVTAWFGRQPYALREAMFFLHRNQITQFMWLAVPVILSFSPMAICFILRLPRFMQAAIVSFSMVSVLPCVYLEGFSGTVVTLVAPSAKTSLVVAVTLMFCGVMGLCSVSAYLVSRRGLADVKQQSKKHQLVLLLTGAFVAVYSVLLVTRATIFVRYALPLIPFILLLLCLLFQDGKQRAIPRVAYLLNCFLLALAISDNHDAYAKLRALKRAETIFVESGGIRNQLRGGFALDMWREIEVAGYVNDPRIVNPKNAFRAVTTHGGKCAQTFDNWTPKITPAFSLADEYGPCSHFIGKPPVGYSTWWPPYSRKIVLGSIE